MIIDWTLLCRPVGVGYVFQRAVLVRLASPMHPISWIVCKSECTAVEAIMFDYRRCAVERKEVKRRKRLDDSDRLIGNAVYCPVINATY